MHRLGTARGVLWASRAWRELQSQVSDSAQQKECSQRVVPKVSSYFLSSGRTSIQMILSSPAFGKIQPKKKKMLPANVACCQRSSQPHVETEPPQCHVGKPKGSGPHTLHVSDQGRTKSFLSNLPSGSMTRRPHNLRFNSKQDRTDQHLTEHFISWNLGILKHIKQDIIF